jgi:hypothetical protein
LRGSGERIWFTAIDQGDDRAGVGLARNTVRRAFGSATSAAYQPYGGRVGAWLPSGGTGGHGGTAGRRLCMVMYTATITDRLARDGRRRPRSAYRRPQQVSPRRRATCPCVAAAPASAVDHPCLHRRWRDRQAQLTYFLLTFVNRGPDRVSNQKQRGPNARSRRTCTCPRRDLATARTGYGP